MEEIPKSTPETKEDQKAQTLEEILTFGDNNFVINRDGDKFPVSELAGKTVMLYFTNEQEPYCAKTLPKILEMYREIKEKKEGFEFEIIYVPSEPDITSFEKYYAGMPWLAIPFGDERLKRVFKRFEHMWDQPSIIPFGPDGCIVSEESQLVAYYGMAAYPFTKDRIQQVEAEVDQIAERWPERMKHHLHEHELCRSRLNGIICEICDDLGYGWSFWCSKCEFTLHPKCAMPRKKEKQRNDSSKVGDDDDGIQEEEQPVREEEKEENYFKWTQIEGGLRSILISEDSDFVIDSGGGQVRVHELVGKTILLFFSSDKVLGCQPFLPKFIDAYYEIKPRDSAFEVIFVSDELDQSAFDEYFSGMPWLGIPCGDSRVRSLLERFEYPPYPAVIAIDPSGRATTKSQSSLVPAYGVVAAYPFTEAHFKDIEERLDSKATECPEKLNHRLHTLHELVRTRHLGTGYVCDCCEEVGYGWSYYCELCMFDLHLSCALNIYDDSPITKLPPPPPPPRRWRPGWRRNIKKRALSS